MTNCNREPIRFPRCKGYLVENNTFPRGNITSQWRNNAAVLGRLDAGVEWQSGGYALTDPSRKVSCRHAAPVLRFPAHRQTLETFPASGFQGRAFSARGPTHA